MSEGNGKDPAATAGRAILDIDIVSPEKTYPEKSVLIAIVSYDRRTEWDVMQCLHVDMQQLRNEGWNVSYVFQGGQMDVPRMRNAIFAAAYTGPFSDLIFIDSDISWELGTGQLSRLLSHQNVEFVGASYSKRMEGQGWTILPMKPGTRPTLPKPGELMQVVGTPTGFLRITRSCMEKMVEAYADRWYYEMNDGGKAWSLFEFGIFNRKRATEDIHFCMLWGAIGGQIWVDPDVHLNHHGDKAYSGSLRGYIEGIEKGEIKEAPWPGHPIEMREAP